MRPGFGLVAVLCGMVGSALLQTLLAVATPVIVAEFNAPQYFEWVAGAYLIASLAATMLAGQLADRAGARPVFMAGWIAYAAGSVLVVGAGDIVGLLAGRVVQGVGAGLIVPAGLAAFGVLFEPRARGTVIGLGGVVQVVATLIGPLWGGWATDGPGWRYGLVPLFALVVAALTFGTALPARTREPGWWRTNPASTLVLLRRGVLARMTGHAALAGAITIAVVTYLPLQLQGMRGLDASASGRLLLALLVASGAGAMAGGRLAGRGWLLPTAWLVSIAGLGLLLVGPDALLVAGLGLLGLGLGPVLPAVLLRAQGAVVPDRLAAASALVQLGRMAGPALVVPLLGLWLRLPLERAFGFVLGSLLGLAAAGLLIALIGEK